MNFVSNWLAVTEPKYCINRQKKKKKLAKQLSKKMNKFTISKLINIFYH